MLYYITEEVEVNSILTFLLSLTALLFAYIFFTKKRRNQLPGPYPWPVVGNALQLGDKPHLTLTEWSKVYGQVFQIKLGSINVVVLNGKDVIQSAIGGSNPDFAARPNMESYKYVNDGYSTVFRTHSLEHSKFYKKLTHNSIKNCLLTKNDIDGCRNNNKDSIDRTSFLEEVLISRSEKFAKTLVAVCRENTDSTLRKKEHFTAGRYSPIYAELSWEITAVLLWVLYGKSYAKSDPYLQKCMEFNDRFGDAVGSANLYDSVPLLRYILPRYLDEFKNLCKKNYEFFLNILNEFENARKNKATNEENKFSNVLENLFIECDKNKENPFFERQLTLSIAADMFGAGIDTTPKSLEWLLSYAAAFPDTQIKIRNEIDNFCASNNRIPLNKVAYTWGFILEVFRHVSVLPFTIPHGTTRKNITINGLKIPDECIVFVNQWSVNRDIKLWGTPNHFRPERFLTKEQTLKPALENQIMTFGIGRRKCPGKIIAEIIIFQLFVSIIRNCVLEQDPDQPGLPKERIGLVKFPQTANFTVADRC